MVPPNFPEYKKSKIFVNLVLFTVVIMMSSGAGSADKTKKILAFGGNGFIGSEVLHKLLQDEDTKYSISLVSRGNWYFDSETRIKPHLTRTIICDREESDIDFCRELTQLIDETDHFDAVLDFSAYKPEALRDALDLLQGKVGVYLYISSDSVYEVCQRTEPEGRPSREEDAVRPTNQEERNNLNDADSYGHAKLAGEEVLTHSENKIPYVIFRLPDVLGPRDTTDRWWTYQMWIDLFKFIRVPIQIPEEVQQLRTSYVYVKDVAQAAQHVLTKGSDTWNQAYNLGFDRDFTLKELLNDMSRVLKKGEEIQYSDDGEFNLFPSVTRGSVNIEKAKTKLGFVPTSWEVALEETVEFYKEAFKTFPSERDDVAHQITRYVVPRERKGEFLRIIDQLAEESLPTVEQESKRTEL